MTNKVACFSLAIVWGLSLAAVLQANPQQSVTVTGCLQMGSEPNNYLLTNVTSVVQNQAPNQMVRSDGYASYVLRDARKHGAKAFLGQRVVVSGTTMTMVSSNQGKISNPPASGNIMGQPGLRVTSIQGAAGSCP